MAYFENLPDDPHVEMAYSKTKSKQYWFLLGSFYTTESILNEREEYVLGD